MSTPELPSIAQPRLGLVARQYPAGTSRVVVFSGDLQPLNLPTFSDQLASALEETGGCVILDLHCVRSVHPLATEILAAALRRAGRSATTIAAATLNGPVRREFESLEAEGLRLHRTVHSALNNPAAS